jgi:hypothetical protein
VRDDRCDVPAQSADALLCGDTGCRHHAASAGIRVNDAPMHKTGRSALRAMSDARGWPLGLRPAVALSAALLICCEPVYAGSTSGSLASATFINSAQANNNDGGAPSIYLGNDLSGGSMRGLIRFALPSTLNQRMVITSADFSLTTGALSGGSPTAATVSLQRLTENWGQGTGSGADPITGDFTYGQACTAGGATWNQPLCFGVPWATAGGTVNGTLSASASAPATSGSAVKWSSTGGTGMASDVQGWVNSPSSNYGWRLLSSTDATSGDVQRFFKSSQLNISFACKAGFLETSGTCTTCTTAAQSACVTSQPGNTCNDSGPPSTTYSCTCNNPAFVLGPGGTSCDDTIFMDGFD